MGSSARRARAPWEWGLAAMHGACQAHTPACGKHTPVHNFTLAATEPPPTRFLGLDA